MNCDSRLHRVPESRRGDDPGRKPLNDCAVLADILFIPQTGAPLGTAAAQDRLRQRREFMAPCA